MPPYVGLLRSRPRRDSSVVRLWSWARRRRRPWTVDEAAAAIAASPRRLRANVAALYEAGLIEQVRPRQREGGAWTAAEWRLPDDAGPPPVLVVDGARGLMIGARQIQGAQP